jgi:glycosyltransferase involved in cell wall biosynthesis
VIVDCETRGPAPVPAVEAIVAALRDSGIDAQVLLACATPLEEQPASVDTVVFPSAGRGNRFDAAAERANGEVLAFIDTRVTLTAEWARHALEVFADPEVAVAGGPIIADGQRMSERVAALIMRRYLGATPAAHNSRVSQRGEVLEVPATNLLIRREVFDAVGGFQTPAGGGESVRLCYKVRSLLGRRINYEPGLALHRPAPTVAHRLVGDIAGYGRFRGDMARRLPESGSFLYALPALFTLVLLAGIVLVAADPDDLAPWALLALAALVVVHLVQSARTLAGRTQILDRLVATIVLPGVLLVFGTAFIRGYLGRSLSEVRPHSDRVPPLRVLVLNWRDVTHPHAGGAEFYMHNMAKQWAADGIDVGWLTQRHAGSARVEVIDRIRIHRVGGRLTQYPRVALKQVQLRRHYDVLVDCENGIPFFSPLYSRLPKVLVVHHVHREIFRQQLPRQVRWLALWLEGVAMPRAYRRTAVVAVSESTRSDLVAGGFRPDQITVIPNGVDPPGPVGVGKAPYPAILCMGRLKPQKSVDVAIRAMSKIVREFPEAELHIIGQGPDRVRLERLSWSSGLAQNVRFHGYVSNAVRDEVSARCWVAVCPSAFEGWGVVCMEASARGLPVVASDVNGLRDSVRDGETGVLVPYGDVDALATEVIGLLWDGERRLRMGQAGLAWAAGYTWSDSASSFAGLLREQLPQPAPEFERPYGVRDSAFG